MIIVTVDCSLLDQFFEFNYSAKNNDNYITQPKGDDRYEET